MREFFFLPNEADGNFSLKCNQAANRDPMHLVNALGIPHPQNINLAGLFGKDLEKIQALILNTSLIQSQESTPDMVIGEIQESYEGDGEQRIRIEKIPTKFTKGLEDIIAFNVNSGVLWPGSVVQGKSILTGVLEPVILPRTPGTLTLHDLTFGGSDEKKFSVTISNPSDATVQDAIQQLLLQKLTSGQPARMTFSLQQVFTLEQAMLKIGASTSWLPGRIKRNFELLSRNNKSQFIVRFVQSYYSVSFSPPASPVAFFTKKATYNNAVINIKSSNGEPNPPAYISEITYGRELWLLIESNEEPEAIDKTLNAAFNTELNGKNLNLAATHVKVIQESTIKVLVLCEGVPVTELITGDKVQELKKYLLKGANYSHSSPSVPISYKLSYLKDNSKVKISFTSEFTAVRRTSAPINLVMTHGFFRFYTQDDDKDEDETVGIAFILDDGEVLHANSNIPPSGTWPDWSLNPSDDYFFIPFHKPIKINDLVRHVTVRITKSKYAGWQFSYEFRGAYSDGREMLIGYSGKITLGDGNPNFSEIKFTLPR
jgi:hypothetical protein